MIRPCRLFRLLLATVVLAATAPAASAHQEPTPATRADDAVTYRPTAVPDRIVLTWTGDPATTQAVTWRTDDSVTDAVAEIAPAGHGPEFVEQSRSVAATTTPLQSDLSLAHHHTAEFTGLRPKTTYAYRVGDGVNWSEWVQFTTADDRPAPFSFIYFGDAQNDVKSMWSRVIRGAYSDAPKAAFIIHAGDLINHADRDGEWGEWFGAGGWVNAMIPQVPIPGNHEYASRTLDDREVRALSSHWRPQFALPQNGPPGLEETCYSFDYQGTRVVGLNTNERLEEQAAWLEGVLRDNPARWTVVTFHHPVYSAAVTRDNPQVRAALRPILEKYGVDLVLQGHDHTYARGYGPDADNAAGGLTTRPAGSGPVYVVSVSGPKQYPLDREPWMARAAEGTQLYQVIHVESDVLRYEARTALGTLYDSFEIRKRNTLVEETRGHARAAAPAGEPPGKARDAAGNRPRRRPGDSAVDASGASGGLTLRGVEVDLVRLLARALVVFGLVVFVAHQRELVVGVRQVGRVRRGVALLRVFAGVDEFAEQLAGVLVGAVVVGDVLLVEGKTPRAASRSSSAAACGSARSPSRSSSRASAAGSGSPARLSCSTPP